MKRDIFKTKNQLYTHRYVFIIAAMAVMLIMFVVISNLGLAASALKTNVPGTYDITFDDYTSMSEEERIEAEQNYSAAAMTGTDAPSVCIYDARNNSVMISTQLSITKQPYTEVESLDAVPENIQLLIVNADVISESDTAVLQSLVEGGTSLLFTGLPDEESLSSRKLRKLLGIKTVSGEATWKGVRTSSDLLTGTMVEKPKYQATGTAVTLGDNTKIYACGLPDKYWNIDNEDLPPIIWRYIADEALGRVYVFNGDFMQSEMGYGILPVVLSEINENYIYPVINAYCVSVTGYPYAENETRESWTRLYSRDRMQIQQDMLSSQLKRYASVYNIRLTCFSPDYDIFQTTDDKDLTYFTNELSSSRAIMAEETDGQLNLGDGVEIVDWTSDFTFYEEGTGTVRLPLCFNSTIEDTKVEEYAIAGFASTMGYFALNIDYDGFMDYSGDEDVWTLYCSDQEVMLGTQERDYEWLDRVTFKEAFGRLIRLLNMEVSIRYSEDHIDLSVDDFSGEAWFILRSDKKNVSIDNGTIEEIGSNCYFVTITAENAEITWEEDNIESLSDR